MSSVVDWSELPPELLQTVATNFLNTADYLRFRGVCSSWRIAAPINPRHLPREFPWLMLPLTSSSRRCFFNPLTKNLHQLSLPESFHSCRLAGSSHGWHVLIGESPSIFLINPLTRARAALPPLSSFPNVLKFDFYSIGKEYTLRSPENDFQYCYSLKEMRDSFVKKVILSHGPLNEPNFVAFTILNKFGDLAYCKIGDDSWTIIHEARSYCEDVIYRNNSFYAVDKRGSIAICDFNDPNSPPRVRFLNMPQKIEGDMHYLVDAMGELFLITRYLDFDIDMEHYHEVCKTVKFSVFRLDFHGPSWEIVNSLDAKLLFLGQNSSFSILASDYRECIGDRVYFTDDYSGENYDGIAGYYDVGVYNMKDGSIEALPCYPTNSHWPIWITPTLC
ncbi:hypothetical protein F511_00964 [Dorcoceras hygrometricum]|uniref:KIB1-4 beta-propeller domain-containing protein n=1 Tax=Dorcoceras hygrometricum TaxID=472368 RepID=A0A2Z7AEB8_9LAMI|nr:hypothetical protein F511_00964 [Dorcoceras hygrometricum]